MNPNKIENIYLFDLHFIII